jgi:hypothetical protein
MLAKLCHNILLRNDPKKHKTEYKNPKIQSPPQTRDATPPAQDRFLRW